MLISVRPPSPGLLASLVRALAVLSLPASDQVEWLHSLGLLSGRPDTDELALELADGAMLAPQFVHEGWLPPTVLEPLRALDELSAAMSGAANAELWTSDALASATEWREARSRAKAILFLI